MNEIIFTPSNYGTDDIFASSMWNDIWMVLIVLIRNGKVVTTRRDDNSIIISFTSDNSSDGHCNESLGGTFDSLLNSSKDVSHVVE